MSHILFLSLWCKHYWGSWKDRYRRKRLFQILLLRYSLHSHINHSRKKKLPISVPKRGHFKFCIEKCENTGMKSFIHSESEARIDRISCDNKLAKWMVAIYIWLFNKKRFNIFWWWSRIAKATTDICNGWLSKIEICFWTLEWQTNYILSYLTGITLEDGVIANFQFQRLRN